MGLEVSLVANHLVVGLTPHVCENTEVCFETFMRGVPGVVLGRPLRPNLFDCLPLAGFCCSRVDRYLFIIGFEADRGLPESPLVDAACKLGIIQVPPWTVK